MVSLARWDGLTRRRYKRSDMGWSATRKKKEMKHPAMRFLVLQVRSREKELVEGGEGDWEDEDEGVVGFLSFMITEEEGERVVYCYELQLDSTSRGLGLGRHLMGVMEDFGRAVGVGKAMLTCFAENKGAMGFYGRNGYVCLFGEIWGVWLTRCRYEKDEISPEPKRLRGGLVKESSYHILSKVL